MNNNSNNLPNNSSLDALATVTIRMKRHKIEAINEQRRKYPVREGKKRLGISLEDWIKDAIDEKLKRSK